MHMTHIQKQAPGPPRQIAVETPIIFPVPTRDAVETITIKFGKGLVGEPFTSKNGKELVEIRIPNSDPNDKRPWQTFVLDARSVHDNKYGKGMWAKIPAEGHTTVQRSVMTVTADGKKQWDHEKRTVSNKELKTMIEFYKEKPRESVMGQLKESQGPADHTNQSPERPAAKPEPPFQGGR